MGWSSPRTWVTGEVVTAALLNAHLRDDLRYLKGLDGIPTIEDSLILSQGADDDAILVLKSSDVAHGMTTLAETDTYGCFLKTTGASGSLTVMGLSEVAYALDLIGVAGAAADTAKATTATAVILLDAQVKSGTGGTAVGANGNLVAIRNVETTRYLFDAEGTLHSIGASYTDSLGNGLWFINDTSNAHMTVGCTINQGGADDEILTLKSSDVAHGVTAITETDTFGLFQKSNATAGGLLVRGFGTGTFGLDLQAIYTTDQTGKTIGDTAAVNVYAAKKSGTSTTNPAANQNLFSIGSASGTAFLFDVEGSAHADVEWVTFDDHDDVGLLNKLDAALTRDPVKTEFGRFLADYRQELQAARIVNFYDDGPRAMLNTTRLSMLLTGAVRQLGQRLALAERTIKALERGL